MMPKAKSTEALTCMNCGAPIRSGFFCAKCVAAGEHDAPKKPKKDDGWKGSRFSGEAKKKRQRELLMEDLATWGKRVVILAVIAAVGWGGWSLFGDRIR